MKLILAPMEGLMDHFLRNIVTAQGGFDLVITEFVRVVDRKLPAKSFLQRAPELNNQGYCNQTPIRIQLLGNHPEAMAENALKAIELGSHGVDLNFGCPSKTVNKSKGGAVLLKEPETIYKVVKAVRNAVPANQTVSAKMRLGYEDTSLTFENAAAIQSAGACALTVHGRTKVEGYRPPAHWGWIKKIQDRLDIPVVANGDVFSVNDYHRCRNESGCQQIMVGRGVVYNPNLGAMIKASVAGQQKTALSWKEIRELVLKIFEDMLSEMPERYVGGRLKQWLSFLKETYPEAETLFDRIRTLKLPSEIKAELFKN